MDALDPLAPQFTPTARRPLLGMTILVVEDSRFASEAMRLMCLHSGARIRRADCLRSARRHLQVYRPSAVVIDLGLPDGSGLDLIEELDRATPRVAAILAVSGNDHMRAMSQAAGADSFLAKPVETIGAFQQAILSALPRSKQPNGPSPVNMKSVEPDPLSFREDMMHVANLLDDAQDGRVLDYIAQFLKGVALVAKDTALAEAAVDFASARSKGRMNQAMVARLAGMVHERIQLKMAI